MLCLSLVYRGERLEKYFGEVFNRLDEPHIEGLNEFLSKACDMPSGAEFLS